MKDKNLNIRVSANTLNEIKWRSKDCGVNKSEFVRLAVLLVKKDDVVGHLLQKINKKYEQKHDTFRSKASL